MSSAFERGVSDSLYDYGYLFGTFIKKQSQESNGDFCSYRFDHGRENICLMC